jgi:hypothetical protein
MTVKVPHYEISIRITHPSPATPAHLLTPSPARRSHNADNDATYRVSRSHSDRTKPSQFLSAGTAIRGLTLSHELRNKIQRIVELSRRAHACPLASARGVQTTRPGYEMTISCFHESVDVPMFPERKSAQRQGGLTI